MKRLVLLSFMMVLGLSVCNAQKRYKRPHRPLASNIKYNSSYGTAAWKSSLKNRRVTGPMAKHTKKAGSIVISKTRITGPKAKNKRITVRDQKNRITD